MAFASQLLEVACLPLASLCNNLEGVVGEVLLICVLVIAFAVGKYQASQTKSTLWGKKEVDFSVTVQDDIDDDELWTRAEAATTKTATVSTTQAIDLELHDELQEETTVAELQGVATLDAVPPEQLMLERDRQCHLDRDHNLQRELEREFVNDEQIADFHDNLGLDLEHLLERDNEALAVECAQSARDALMLHTQLAQLSCELVSDSTLDHDRYYNVERDLSLQRELESELAHDWDDGAADGLEHNERNLQLLLEADSVALAFECAHSARDTLMLHAQSVQLSCEPTMATVLEHDRQCHLDYDRNLLMEVERELGYDYDLDLEDDPCLCELEHAVERDAAALALENAHSARDMLMTVK